MMHTFLNTKNESEQNILLSYQQRNSNKYRLMEFFNIRKCSNLKKMFDLIFPLVNFWLCAKMLKFHTNFLLCRSKV